LGDVTDERLAPPARAVDALVPTSGPIVRGGTTVATEKFAGKLDAVVIVAGMPMLEKSCV
jgi:hypothetical protein